MLTHGYHQKEDVLPAPLVVAQVRPQGRPTTVGRDPTDGRHELLGVPWLQQSQQGSALVALRTEPEDRADVTAHHLDGPLVIGQDAGDGDVVLRRRPGDLRPTHADGGETESVAIQIGPAHRDLGRELLAVALPEESDGLIALQRSRGQQLHGCFDRGPVGGADDLGGGDTVQGRRYPADQLVAGFVGAEDGPSLEIDDEERMRVVAEKLGDGLWRGGHASPDLVVASVQRTDPWSSAPGRSARVRSERLCPQMTGRSRRPSGARTSGRAPGH